MKVTKTKEHYYFDEHGLILTNNKVWGTQGKGDAMWRTTLYGCYLEQKFMSNDILDSLKPLFDSEKLLRHPDESKGISRDQIAMLLCFLQIGEYEFSKEEVLRKLKWKLSDFHSQTIDFWLWHKSLNGSRVFSTLFILFTFVQFLFILPYNWLLRKIGGFKTVPSWQYEYKEKSAFQELIADIRYPDYAWFILIHQVICIRDSRLRRLLERFLLLGCEESNLLLRTLLGGYKVTETDIYYYESFSNIRWNNRLDGTANESMYKLTEEEKGEFDMDRELLQSVNYLYQKTHQ